MDSKDEMTYGFIALGRMMLVRTEFSGTKRSTTFFAGPAGTSLILSSCYMELEYLYLSKSRITNMCKAAVSAKGSVRRRGQQVGSRIPGSAGAVALHLAN